MAVELSDEFGVVNYVGQEISYGAHLNTWGSWVPMVDYTAHPNGLSAREVVDFVHSNGSIVSLNHYVGNSFERVTAENDPKALDEYFQNQTASLIQHHVFGADIFELHHNSPDIFRAYLRVWDGLNRNGMYITGNGVSDAHGSGPSGWLQGRNQVTWVLALSTGERDLIEGLRRGAAYFGDPSVFRGSLTFATEDGHEMGQIVETTTRDHTLRIRLTELPLHSRVQVIVDGEIFKEWIARQSFLDETMLLPTVGRTFARLGVWTENGRGLVFSNPIYFVPSGDLDGVPDHRLASCRP